METTASFGYWVRRQRKALDLTQKMLAERVGCSVAAIKKIEGDERKPSRQIAARMADILHVPDHQREIFLECARGLRSVDQLVLAREPVTPSLPTGTVTFLYTDIEGSTTLWEQQPQAMAVAHARHNEIVRKVIEANHGYVFQVIGDGFCGAFHTAGDALRAAVECQVDLQAENWGETPIRVRIGIHTGKAEIQEDGLYRGYLTMSHVQRLTSVGHGGQVLLSSTTQELMQDELPEGVEWRDLGVRQLKDWKHPEHIFQLAIPGLRVDFPPLKIPKSFSHNLPAPLTSFVGREREMAEVKQLLTNTRLLTLTGPGGTGKTRLALQLAGEILDAFADGVWLVDLAPLADPTLVTQTVASTLAVREQPGRTILQALLEYLRAKNMLLILDNCEHLIEVCAQLANTLLRAASGLKILASSRETLGIAGETVYHVPSLPLPDMQEVSFDALSQNDCIRLFTDRALAAYPTFQLKEKIAPAIADICRKLDGIPLAIELAAARIKVLRLEQIATLLDDRFRLLAYGSRAALPRHQTLRALIDWSYDLLSREECTLLRRLSVFAGGWSDEAAQKVCGEGLVEDMLELLANLMDKSLVAREEQGEETRYHFLETIRQYGRDKLSEAGEVTAVRDSHLEYFVRFAELTEPKLKEGEQLICLERTETEHDNLRTALAWSLESGEVTAGLRLAGALWLFWDMHSHQSEALAHLEKLLARTSDRTLARAKAMFGAGLFKYRQGEYESARTLLQESLPICRELGDKDVCALSLGRLSSVAYTQGNYAESLLFANESLALYQELDDRWGIANILNGKGELARLQGDYEAAGRFYEESLALSRELGDKFGMSILLHNLAYVVQHQGDYQRAASLFKEGLTTCLELREKVSVALAVAGLAGIAGLTEQPERAACLFGAAQTALVSLGIVLDTIDRSDWDRDIQTVKTQLESEVFATFWEEGCAMSLEQAVEYINAFATE